MDEILSELQAQKNINIRELTSEQDLSNKSFKERAWLNYLRKNYERIVWYYDQVASMTKGKENLGDFDAAKQIMIGTIKGNY